MAIAPYRHTVVGRGTEGSRNLGQGEMINGWIMAWDWKAGAWEARLSKPMGLLDEVGWGPNKAVGHSDRP